MQYNYMYNQRVYQFKKQTGREPNAEERELLKKYSRAEVVAYIKIKTETEGR